MSEPALCTTCERPSPILLPVSGLGGPSCPDCAEVFSVYSPAGLRRGVLVLRTKREVN